MTFQGWVQIAVYVAVLTALTPLIGAYMARVYRGDRVLLSPVFGPLERLVYRLLRVNPAVGQNWKEYARSVLVLSALFWIALYVILRTQGIHPFNPGGLRRGALGRDLQHHLVVHLEHELAVLRRRDDALLLLADDRPRGAELHLGRGRHRRRRGGDPRLRRAAARHSATSGRTSLRTLLYVLLPISFVARSSSSRRV